MVNMTDGKSDGLMLAYVKDGVVYPIALSEENLEMLDLTIGMMLKEITLINKPMGKVISLLK